MKRLYLRHKITGKTRSIEKRDAYPAAVGDQIRFSRFSNMDDVWIVERIKDEGEVKVILQIKP